jgi:branched-chain amino acid transport system substrate-binding protein
MRSLRQMPRVLMAFAAAAILASIALPTRAADPFEINAILPLTGNAAFIGKGDQKSLSVLEQLTNKAGGVRGRPIKFVFYDDQSNPQVSIQLLNLVKAKNPAVIMGPAFTATCRAALPLIADGPLVYCLSPGIHPPVGSYMFSAQTSTNDMLKGAVTYMREKGWRKIALMASTDATGQDGEQQIAEILAAPENASMAIVDREHFNTSDISVAAQVTHIKQSGAQALLAWVSGPSFATILRGIDDVGLDVPLMASPANLIYGQIDGYGSIMPNSAVLFPANPAVALDVVPRGAMRNAVSRFQTAMKDAGSHADQGTDAAWDPAQLILDGYRKLGFDATPQQFRDYLSNLGGWTGIYGVYNFKDVPQRGVDSKYIVVVQWDKKKNEWAPVSGFGGVPKK